jgi:septum formation protein
MLEVKVNTQEKKKSRSLILASKSPRRQEMIKWLDLPFSIRTTDVEEISSFTDPKEIVEDLAKLKGVSVLNETEDFDEIIVASDTIVTLDGKVYGKPETNEKAKEMLLELSGKTHQVLTAVYIGKRDQGEKEKRDEHIFSCSTDVTFNTIDEDLLANYLKTNDSLDKAGAYGIQGQALTFISNISGSYSNVVGFPVDVFIQELKSFLGFENDSSGSWRESFI